MTVLLFREDPYLRRASARAIAVGERGVTLDRTPFYARGGGQPGDVGALVRADGARVPIAEAVWSEDRGAVLHVPAPGAPPLGEDLVGEELVAELDWEIRHKRMRIHTALHLLSVVLPYPVTGGAIGDGEGRLDFDIPEAGLDREAIAERLNALVAADAPVSERWIADAELDANPGLVKTMSAPPPRGGGRVRLVAIGDVDLQPCGGTHVARTSEIGPVVVVDIQKKGKQNRRVRIALA